MNQLDADKTSLVQFIRNIGKRYSSINTSNEFDNHLS